MTLIYERFRTKFSDTKIIEKIKDQILIKRLASFVVLAVLMPIHFVPTIASDADNKSVYESNLKMAIDSPYVLVSDNKISEIKPGESKTDKEAREKAEAEALARAEAEMKAKTSGKARNSLAREARTYSDPSDFNSVYQRAQNAYGVDSRILSAIHQIETGRSGSTGLKNRGGSGAQGPMQFMPSTWRHYGVDGNGDGVADINNVEDSVFAAARYLKACGYPNVKKALWGYNPSGRYYTKVMGIAQSLGF